MIVKKKIKNAYPLQESTNTHSIKRNKLIIEQYIEQKETDKI
jgi:hypothetical protein